MQNLGFCKNLEQVLVRTDHTLVPAGHAQYRNAGAQSLQLGHQFYSVGARHEDVGDNGVNALIAQDAQAALAVLRGDHGMAQPLKQLHDKGPVIDVIIDDENFCHFGFLFLARHPCSVGMRGCFPFVTAGTVPRSARDFC